MQVTPSDVPRLAEQANADRYRSVEQHIFNLLERDADRVAIMKGLADMKAGRGRPAEDVEAERRREVRLPPRS